MAEFETLLEMRGMKRIEIIDYFIGINGEDLGFGKFAWQDWGVDVSEESLVSIGSIEFPSTKVLFYGNKEQLEKMIYAFRQRFLTAGG